MRKWRFTWVAYDEANNFSVEVNEDELGGEITGNKIFLVGGSKLPRELGPTPWKTWRIEELHNDRQMLGEDKR